jgi:hypothetical protein
MLGSISHKKKFDLCCIAFGGKKLPQFVGSTSRAVFDKPSCLHCLALVGTESAEKPFAHFSPNMV